MSQLVHHQPYTGDVCNYGPIYNAYSYAGGSKTAMRTNSPYSRGGGSAPNTSSNPLVSINGSSSGGGGGGGVGGGVVASSHHIYPAAYHAHAHQNPFPNAPFYTRAVQNPYDAYAPR